MVCVTIHYLPLAVLSARRLPVTLALQSLEHAQTEGPALREAGPVARLDIQGLSVSSGLPGLLDAENVSILA